MSRVAGWSNMSCVASQTCHAWLVKHVMRSWSNMSCGVSQIHHLAGQAHDTWLVKHVTGGWSNTSHVTGQTHHNQARQTTKIPEIPKRNIVKFIGNEKLSKFCNTEKMCFVTRKNVTKQ